MAWEIDETRTRQWANGLLPDQRDRLQAALNVLGNVGPDLKGPLVKRIKSSRHHNMKELRPLGTKLRILFAFDHDQKAVLLVGGDKTGQWNRWYKRNVPRADQIYDQHRRSTGQEAACRTPTRGTPKAPAR